MASTSASTGRSRETRGATGITLISAAATAYGRCVSSWNCRTLFFTVASTASSPSTFRCGSFTRADTSFWSRRAPAIREDLQECPRTRVDEILSYTPTAIGPRTAQHLRLGVFVPKPPAPCGPGWSAHQNIDMCGQGDVEIIHNWRATHSIEDLQRIVE